MRWRWKASSPQPTPSSCLTCSPRAAAVRANRGILDGRRDRLAQSRRRKFAPWDRRWPRAELRQTPAPRELIHHVRDDHGRDAGPQRRGGRPGAAVVHGRRAAFEQPAVIDRRHREHVRRQLDAGPHVQVPDEHSASARERLDRQFVHRGGVRCEHAAEPEAHGRLARVEELAQLRGWIRVQRVLEKPVAGHVGPRPRVDGRRRDGRAVGVQLEGPAVLEFAERLAERKRGQSRVAADRAEPWPGQQPGGLSQHGRRPAPEGSGRGCSGGPAREARRTAPTSASRAARPARSRRSPRSPRRPPARRRAGGGRPIVHPGSARRRRAGASTPAPASGGPRRCRGPCSPVPRPGARSRDRERSRGARTSRTRRRARRGRPAPGPSRTRAADRRRRATRVPGS